MRAELNREWVVLRQWVFLHARWTDGAQPFSVKHERPGACASAQSSFSSMVLDQVAALGSSDISVRMDAVAELALQPDAARPALVAVLVDPSTSARTCVWAMIALCQLPHGEDRTVARALVHCLKNSEAIVRRSAVDMLGSLKVAWAVPDIANLLSDHEPIDSGWFDDDATPSRAAIRALELIDSPEAKALLAASRRT